MKLNMTKTGPKISNKEIKLLENKIGFELPNEYRKFLLKYNGGEPDPYFFQVPGWQYQQSLVSELKGINPDKTGLDLNQIIEIKKHDLPNGVIPIGSDPGGNLILLDLKNGKVYFWDHEESPNGSCINIHEYENVYLLSNSFNGFIKNLKHENEL